MTSKVEDVKEEQELGGFEFDRSNDKPNEASNTKSKSDAKSDEEIDIDDI